MFKELLSYERDQTKRLLASSEDRFANLIALSSSWYWEMDSDLRFTTITQSIGPQWGVISSQIIGQTRWELPGSDPTPFERAAINDAVAAHLPYRDLGYHLTGSNGSRYYVQSSADPIFDRHGKFAGYRGVDRDRTATKRAEELLYLAHEIERILAEADNEKTALNTILKALCETEHWDLGRYFEVDQSALLLRFSAFWGAEQEEVAEIIAASRGLAIASDENLIGLVWRSGDPLWSLEQPEAPSVDRPGIRLTNMAGTLVFPVRAAGHVIGILSLTRQTTLPPDQLFMQAVTAIGEQLGQYILRKNAEDATRKSEARFRNLTALSSDWYWQSDRELRYVFISQSTLGQGIHEGLTTGMTKWQLPGVMPTAEERDAIDVAEAARLPYRELGYQVVTADGVKHYVQFSADPMFEEDHVFLGYRGVARDITERRRAEQILQIEHAIALSLAEANDTGTTLTQVIRTICESEDWDLGRYFAMEDSEGLLRMHVSWGKQGPAVAQFLENSASHIFRAGQGLVGEAWASHEPVWAADSTSDARVMFGNHALATGMHGAFGFPVSSGGKKLGVLVFTSQNIRSPDARLLRAVRVIGVQIGLFITRQKQRDNIVRLNRIYRMLSGINALVVRVQGREELFAEACRVAVDEGQFSLAWIGTVDGTPSGLRFASGSGVAKEYFVKISDSLLASSEDQMSAASAAVQQNQPFIINSIETAPNNPLQDAALSYGFQSLCALPLRSGSSVAGVLCLYADSKGLFDSDEMKLLVELSEDISFAIDHLAKSERLQYLAYYDALTGLANHSLFVDRLTQSVAHAARHGERLAVLIYDIVRFKDINDMFGRDAGDAVLKQIAVRASQLVDPTWLGRTGGDRFVSMRPQYDSLIDIDDRMVERMRLILSKPFRVGQIEIHISVRIGVAIYPEDSLEAGHLLQNAEIALKRAKLSGERYLFFNQNMTERLAEKMLLASKLQIAIANEEFVLHYQPQIDSTTSKVVGLEALIRWQSPELGLVPPLQFVPLLEENGMIVEVGLWVIRQAVIDCAWLTNRMTNPPRISVNVSALQLRRQDFIETLRSEVAKDGSLSQIDIEITESTLIGDLDEVTETLQQLRLLGISVAIDDFGTGYSSLAYLSKLRVQVLKIDRSFIITMLHSPDAMSLVSAMISLAHSLRLGVVAEGVDDEEQAKALRSMGCDRMQGYLFSKPRTLQDLLPMLEKQ